MNDRERVIALQQRLYATDDEEEKKRIRDALAEHEGYALTGDAHGREGADETS